MKPALLLAFACAACAVAPRAERPPVEIVSYAVDAGVPVHLEFVVRNTQGRPICMDAELFARPVTAMLNARLRDASRRQLRQAQQGYIAELPLPPVRLGPGMERRATLDLRGYFVVPPDAPQPFELNVYVRGVYCDADIAGFRTSDFVLESGWMRIEPR